MSRIFSTLSLAVLITASSTTFAAHSVRLQSPQNLADKLTLSREQRGAEAASLVLPSKHKKHKKKMNKQMKKRKRH
jgi:hypothetical protein